MENEADKLPQRLQKHRGHEEGYEIDSALKLGIKSSIYQIGLEVLSPWISDLIELFNLTTGL